MRLKGAIVIFAAVQAVNIAACTPDIPQNPPAQGVHSSFDPAADDGIPLPNDMLIDSKTGLLSLPALPGDSELTVQIKQAQNAHDGWLASQAVGIPYLGKLKTDTLNSKNVMMIDLDSVTAISPEKYMVLFNRGLSPAVQPPYLLQIKNMPAAGIGTGNPPADFRQGGRYMVIATTDALGEDGFETIENEALYFLSCPNSLIMWGQSATILPTAEARLLEAARSAVFDPAWTAVEKAGIADRTKASAFTVFTIQSGPKAVFDPIKIPLIKDSVLPYPNDLNGPAKAPVDVRPYIHFDLKTDPSTLAAGVKMFMFAPDGMEEIGIKASISDTPDAKTGYYKLTIIPSSVLEHSAEYMVMTTTAVRGLPKNGAAAGAPASEDLYFSLMRASVPLITAGSASPGLDCTLNSPFIDRTLDALILMGYDPRKVANGGTEWKTAFNQLCSTLAGIEKLRATYNTPVDPSDPSTTLLGTAEKAGNVKLQDITALWTFTTAAD